MILECHPAFLSSSSVQGLILRYSTRQIPEEAKVCFPEVQVISPGLSLFKYITVSLRLIKIITIKITQNLEQRKIIHPASVGSAQTYLHASPFQGGFQTCIPSSSQVRYKSACEAGPAGLEAGWYHRTTLWGHSCPHGEAQQGWAPSCSRGCCHPLHSTIQLFPVLAFGLV